MSRNFSIGAFLQGLGLAGVLLLGGAGFLQWKAGETAQNLESRLPSQTIPVVRDAPLPLEQAEKAESDLSGNPALPGPRGQEESPSASISLPPAPVEGLHEETALGPKPVIRAKDGLTSFQAYRRPFDSYASDSPAIALALIDAGMSSAQMKLALDTLPADISFILSPYAASPQDLVDQSRAQGHEVWFSLPVETAGYPENDTGPRTLLMEVPESENISKLDWLMTRAAGYAGFVTGYNPVFMESIGDMRPVAGTIFGSGLALIDGSASPGIVQQTMASGMKAPYANIDVWVDWPDSSPEAIRRSLEKLESIARENGAASGIIHVFPGTYAEILAWLKTFPEKNLRLAPLSATTGY